MLLNTKAILLLLGVLPIMSWACSVPHTRYIDFSQGSDQGRGTLDDPWQTLVFAYEAVTDATPNNPYTFVLSGGPYTLVGTLNANPNINLFSYSQILLDISSLVIAPATNNNDSVQFTNIGFFRGVEWTSNVSSGALESVSVIATGCVFYTSFTFTNYGQFGVWLQTSDSNIVGLTMNGPNGVYGEFVGTYFYETTFSDTNNGFLIFTGGYNSGAMSISGAIESAYFQGFVQDVPNGASVTVVTTANGTPVLETDSAGLPPTVTGSPTLVLNSQAAYESYAPASPETWMTNYGVVPTTVQQALDLLVGS